jgi:antagonist of KipI
MASVEVIASGLLTTVQDLGRDGYGPWGVSASGAADAVALRIANRLVGNAENAAALEMTLLGGTFRFPNGGVASVTGSNFGATLDDAPIAMWAAVRILPGQTLAFGPTRSGARCYLAVHGGIRVPAFLGSASTHLLSRLGGFDGRPLRKGDVLAAGPPSSDFVPARVPAGTLEQLAPRKRLRVTLGLQASWFDQAALAVFYNGHYTVAEESNRTGIRLTGPPVSGAARELLTEGAPLGAIQIPAGGQPIIVFVEQQTTGGYPKIANVVSADLHSVGQLRPRDVISFEGIDFDAAQGLLIEQERLLSSEWIAR